ncbi:hypothetical protein Hypma_011689 [Hypsizygus marmoreus]|uniref:Uncharacterized protein n=1 Tax=Hypsizygus marmoreus TaxID=39966 RepID=A0A369JGF6_HYPMA|nr:hypothetical protein Hypma_011689 [Hypsizygus marmoreus]
MSSTSQSYDVNNLLHTLRGEQFRHSQNVLRSRTHISATPTRSSPTLPADLISLDYPNPDYEPAKPVALLPIVHDTPTWRANALSLVLPETSHEPGVPLLTNLCLRIVASTSNSEFTEDVAPYLPPHLRRDLVRHTAIHSPLPSSKLYALYEPEGHADSEVIIVGPNAALRDNHFLRTAPVPIDTPPGSTAENDEDDDSWESEESVPEPLSTLILISTRLSASSLLSLPPTLTKLALINLPVPISVHRLPRMCPLLTILDLSYNDWLRPGSSSAESTLDRVEWSRWNHLHILGLRECNVSSEMLVKLNRGRWDDVEVVQ